MKMSWQTTDRLSCRWSEVGERLPYNSPWIQDASTIVHMQNVPPWILAFARLSPFGGGNWYAPHRRLASTKTR